MAHAQKPDLVFRRNGRVHLSRRGASVHSNTGSRGVRISGSNAGYTMLRGSVKGTGYPLHSSVSPSLPLPCGTVCHHISTGLHYILIQKTMQFFIAIQISVLVRRFVPFGFMYLFQNYYRIFFFNCKLKG